MHHKEGQYLIWAVGFCGFMALILLFLGVDYIFRQIKTSHFDGSTPLVIAEPQNTYLVIDPQNKSIHTVFASPDEFWPYDIQASADIPVSSVHPENIALALYTSSQSHLSSFDAFKLWLFTKGGVAVTATRLSSNQFLLNKSPFWDSHLAQENKTIQIINASGVTGEGSDLAQLLGDYGLRVISVETGIKTLPATSVTAAGSSYTLTRLGHLLHTPPIINVKNQNVADIVILVGEKEW